MEFTPESIQKYVDMGVEMAMGYAPKIILAIAIFIIGSIIVNMMVKVGHKAMDKAKTDKSVQGFLLSLLRIGGKIMVILAAVSALGVQTSSFIAILGAAGLAVGLALQGSLANFAGGVLILFFKPFKVGDFISTQGQEGIVDKIEIFNTIIHSLDNKKIILPNGAVSNDALINFTTEGKRRVDHIFGIGYDDDIKKAKEVMYGVMKKDKRIIDKEPNFVGVESLGDNSVNFTFRAWVKTADYWDVYFDTLEAVKLEFDKAGISIPFPQRDVHLYQEK